MVWQSRLPVCFLGFDEYHNDAYILVFLLAGAIAIVNVATLFEDKMGGNNPELLTDLRPSLLPTSTSREYLR
jgi:hypothetical protein